jgi:hypothetical protein
MLHAGLDLSRRRVDVCLLDERGELVGESAVPADADGLRVLAGRLAGQRVRAVIESMNGARFAESLRDRRASSQATWWTLRMSTRGECLRTGSPPPTGRSSRARFRRGRRSGWRWSGRRRVRSLSSPHPRGDPGNCGSWGSSPVPIEGTQLL